MVTPGPLLRNRIGGRDVEASSGRTFVKRSPHDGRALGNVVRSDARDVAHAVEAARAAFPGWASTPPVLRGETARRLCAVLRSHRREVADIVAAETGKSPGSALAETDGAILLGEFFAGEGQRLFGRSLTSATPHRYGHTVRQPVGVAGLIVPANTPIANVAWKVFPALVCGNAAVLKSAEDAPATADIFVRLAEEAGVPAGVLNLVHGLGAEAGAALVEHAHVDVVSFTGSTAVGKWIARTVADRLARVSLELGGKNPFVVCDDADLDAAARWATLSAFSNAGQRCASGSRIIVFDAVYERFRAMLVERAQALRVGPADADDFGPLISERQLENVLQAIAAARSAGARVLVGGERLTGAEHRQGWYLGPTLIEGADPEAPISCTELFGPVATLYRVKDFDEALAVANRSPYGLTSCIHTGNVHRAVEFCQRVQAGVAVVNAGTFGSEPHMPFGGVKQSGNGTREPGTEALDVYTNLKNVVFLVDPGAV